MAATLGTQPQLAHDGWPLVESESSLLDFLNLCHTGARVNSEVLQCTVQKNEDGLWTGYGEKDLTSLELLLGFRAELLQYDKEMTEADLERTLMSIDPVDSIKIKREVAAGGEQEDDDSDDDDANQKGVRLAIIDVTGDGGPVETDTFDAGASSSSAKPLSHTPAYRLVLTHLVPVPHRLWLAALGGSCLAPTATCGSCSAPTAKFATHRCYT